MSNTTGKKFGGRKKGTPNKLTSELRTLLKNFIHEELEELPVRLDGLEVKDRVEILIKILPYILPKVNNVNLNEDEPLKWPGT